MMIHKNIATIIGGTPLLELTNYGKQNDVRAKIIAKLEYLNPAGSVKDRVAREMLNDAESRGMLKPGAVIIEPTSGNTGIGLAALSAARGYRLILTMPETMSVERRKLFAAYGAEVVLTKGSESMKGAISKAEQLAEEMKNSHNVFMPRQFENPANPAAHKKTTGPEIWAATACKVDYLVCGVGTGGTLSGAGEFLKSKNTNIKLIAVEPSSSPAISLGRSGSHGIQGIGAGFVPKTLNTDLIDEIICVKDSDAIAEARQVAKTDGVLVGISSGAALHAARQIACRQEAFGKTIVVIFPDSGERYLSASLF